MNDQYTFEEIEEYLSGTLAPDAMNRLEEAMRDNPALRDTVEKHRQVHGLVKQYALSRINERVREISREEKRRSTGDAFRWMKVAAAVTILCLAGTYFFINMHYSTDTLYRDAFQPYPNRFSTMGTATENSFAEGMKHYDNGEYALAVQQFSSVDPGDEYALPATFYTAVSMLALDQPDEAIKILLPLSSSNVEYAEAAKWYLALAYLTKGDEPNARKLLTVIVNSKGYRSKDAEELLLKLKSVWRKLPGI